MTAPQQAAPQVLHADPVTGLTVTLHAGPGAETVPSGAVGDRYELRTTSPVRLPGRLVLTAAEWAALTRWAAVGPVVGLAGGEDAQAPVARSGFPAGWLLRPGGHCAAKGGLTTLWAYDPAEQPDDAGRRPSDVNVGTVLTPQLATDLCDAYNARAGREDHAADLRAWILHDPGTVNASTLAEFIHDWDQP